MDVERNQDGSWHFRLGIVERWVVGLAALALVSGAGYVLSDFKKQMGDQLSAQRASLVEQQKSLDELVLKQAVANTQLQQLNQQLADVPAIVRSLAEIKVRTDEHERRIHELEQVRKLR